MIALQKEGKIRHRALSNVGPAELAFALARTPIVSVQNLYSVSGGGGEPPHGRGLKIFIDSVTKDAVSFAPPVMAPASSRNGSGELS